ncbi:NitT/TauT family transport system substrate-binding protein [Neisseria sp. HSC-16F19]|nr:ABC transporter substrate-binding protein [Neisseria sp. HSC-16F19]MCP2040224.1 NitT/TauT family transport system substrate-binding protein [Neisseria sp. HSC-16F19]
MQRREFLKLATLFTAAGALPLLQACGQRQSAQAADAPLRIGYLPITDATPLLVAHARGLFAQHGVTAERPAMFRSWAQLVEAFISGEVNVIHLLSPMTIWARYGSESPVKTVLWNHMAGSALTVAPDINRIADLSGQTVAIPFWYSIHNVVLQHLLRENGLKVTEKDPGAGEVKLSVMAPSDMVAALAAGTVAGFIVAEPFNAAAEVKGVGKVLRFSADVWRDHACCVTLMHEHDIDTRPEWTQGVVNALVEAQLWSNQNRAETAALLAKGQGESYTPHEEAVLKRVLAPEEAQWAQYVSDGVIRHPEWHQNRIDFQPYPFPSYTEKLVEMLQQTHIAGENHFLHKLNPQQVAADLVDTRFVREALKHNNAMAAFGLPESLSRTEEVAA